MTAAERIQEKIQKLRALHKSISKGFLSHGQVLQVRSALPALLDVAEAAQKPKSMAPDDPWVAVPKTWVTGLDAALQRLGEPDDEG